MLPSLEEAIIEFGIETPNELQQNTFSTIKSGRDCLIISPENSGKTTLIVLSVIQQLEKAYEQSPRALIMVTNRSKVEEMSHLFKFIGSNTDLRVYTVSESSDIDNDKNLISAGVDILIGTPKKLNTLLVSAGYDVNQLKMFVVDDFEQIIRDRHEPTVTRISTVIPKTQQLFFANNHTQKVEDLADKLLVNPVYF
jgi:ATP-dependent RNA helicase RhlE